MQHWSKWECLGCGNEWDESFYSGGTSPETGKAPAPESVASPQSNRQHAGEGKDARNDDGQWEHSLNLIMSESYDGSAKGCLHCGEINLLADHALKEVTPIAKTAPAERAEQEKGRE